MSKIFVVGSINVDYVMEITHLPLLGETLPSQSFLMNFGGKGANQAVALAKQNEEVYIFLKGEGVFTVDGKGIQVKEGSCVKVLPAASRTLENSGEGELQFICVQAKEKSLEQFGMGDAELC